VVECGSHADGRACRSRVSGTTSNIVRACRGIAPPLFSLTYDDGTSAWTDAILDEMKAHDAHGTFFVLGQAIDGDATRQETLRRIVREGSEIGNHSYHHRDLPQLSDEEIREQLVVMQGLITDLTGSAPMWWRPPYFRADDRVRGAIQDLDLHEIHCSINPRDWKYPAAIVVQHVLERLQPGDIVVLHDGKPPDEPPGVSLPDRLGTVQAVAAILKGASARGMQSVTVSELLEAAREASS